MIYYLIRSISPQFKNKNSIKSNSFIFAYLVTNMLCMKIFWNIISMYHCSQTTGRRFSIVFKFHAPRISECAIFFQSHYLQKFWLPQSVAGSSHDHTLGLRPECQEFNPVKLDEKSRVWIMSGRGKSWSRIRAGLVLGHCFLIEPQNWSRSSSRSVVYYYKGGKPGSRLSGNLAASSLTIAGQICR